MKVQLGIDLGGTKIEIIALDGNGQTLLRRRVATPVGDYQATLAIIKDLVLRADAELGARCPVGFGTPGSASLVDGRMRNCNSTCLNGQHLHDDLAQLLDRSVAIANDANCFALSEAADGAGAGAKTVFGVIIGTGAGAGIVIDGKLLEGANRVAGEWGHNPLPWPRDEERPGLVCYCGKSGCVETFISGPGLKLDHRIISQQVLEPYEIVSLANSGDSACVATMQRYEDRLARALAHVINIIDPEVIVLGGGMSNIERLYDNVPPLWPRYVFSDVVQTQLRRNVHGDSSGVRGAARLTVR
ncbi:MAG: ROK family protein [Burkholderiales bacterium]